MKTRDYCRYVVSEDDPRRVEDEDGYFICQCSCESNAREFVELRDFYYQHKEEIESK